MDDLYHPHYSEEPIIRANDRGRRCALCRQVVPGAIIERHHLIPRSQKGKHYTAPVHMICHRIIHSLFTNAQLAKELYAIDMLRNHPAVIICINWVCGMTAIQLNRKNIGIGSLPKLATNYVKDLSNPRPGE